MTAGVVLAPLIMADTGLHTRSSRSHIDTDTAVFMQSDTPGALIFYTLDGSRPEKLQSASRGSKYVRPIRLPAGRVAIRAVAITSDGRESSIVTKTFVVQNRDSRKEKVLQTSEQPPPEEPSSSSGFPELWIGGDDSSKSLTAAAQAGAPVESSDPLKQTITQTSTRTQNSEFLQDKEVITDADLQCVRPDLVSRFCLCCGAEASGQTLVPAEQEKALCGSCGSLNPGNLSSCLTCESRLQPMVCVSSAASDGPLCSTWKRFNQHQSRSCCSLKADSCVVCWRCGASGHPRSRHCTACGVLLSGSAPPTCDVTTAPPVEDTFNSRATPLPVCTWNLATPTAHKSTQTVGLYFPSAAQMQKESERAGQQAPRGRHPPLTSVSPGKGYWRKQLDHMCAHLRSYAQNNAPFRSLLGDPRLGQLVSALVLEDQQQLTLTVSFALAGPVKEDAAVPDPPAGGSSLTGSRRSTQEVRLPPQVQAREALLLAELGPGRGRLSVVEQLLDQGADPASRRADGRHALAVAALHRHHQLLPVLVQRGADVDQQSGPMKNSALHEAAALGADGLQCVQVLLSCGASARRKNVSGQTAFDVAAASGCSSMVSLLATHAGLVLLDRLAKTK